MKTEYFNKLKTSLVNMQTHGKQFWTLWNNIKSGDLDKSQLLTIQILLDQYDAWLTHHVDEWETITNDSQ